MKTVKEVRRQLKAARQWLDEITQQFYADLSRYRVCGVSPACVERQYKAGLAVIARYKTEVVEDLENQLADLETK